MDLQASELDPIGVHEGRDAPARRKVDEANIQLLNMLPEIRMATAFAKEVSCCVDTNLVVYSYPALNMLICNQTKNSNF